MRKPGLKPRSGESRDDPMAWFVDARPRYDALKAAASTIIENLVVNAEIDYLSVSARTKTIESFQHKIARKQYTNPKSEMTDLVGIRIICYIESDVERVCALIHETMRVYPLESPDKTSALAVDLVGYRSTHFVCDLGPIRLELPEYKLFHDTRFEVQVRTVLQHAWAEIEHDRSYKFSGTLPPELSRRLFLLAGTLEVVDREFSNIAKDIDHYATTVTERTRSGDLAIEIDSVSLDRYIREKFKNEPRIFLNEHFAVGAWLLDQIHSVGISTLEELDNLLTPELLDKAFRVWITMPAILLIGSALKAAYPELLFKNVDTVVSDLDKYLLTQRYGRKQFMEWVKTYNLVLLTPDPDEQQG